MTPADRFKNWIVGLAQSWGEALGTFLLEKLASGLTKAAEDQEPAVKESARLMLADLMANPAVPEEFKVKVRGALGAGNLLETIYLELIMILQSVGTLIGGSVPIANELRYAQDFLKRSSRLDPASVITGWRRDPDTFEKYLDDLREQGWSDERIEALKFVTLFYPAPQDLVNWQAKEVFEPAMISKYGLDDELGGIQREPFYKAGMTDEQITNFWRAHWEHASWQQIVEMLHRGLITEADVRDWFRLVEIPPFWRQLLIDSAYTWPTRVDVRRWWDMRTIDEAELRRLYSGMGYRGVNLDNYILWTKVYVAFPDLMARWSKGWITEEDVRRELIGLGMPADRVTEMIQTKIKPTEQEPITEAKQVSQTAIIKWVKEDEEARWEQGVDLLMDLGYDENGARFVLDAYIAGLGSPETYEDWKKVTAEYKKVVGREANDMPEELVNAANELVKITETIRLLEESVRNERLLLVDQDVIPEENEKRLKDLNVALNRAKSEKQRLQDSYNSLVAEFKQAEG